MRYNLSLARRYRKDGYLFISKDVLTGDYEIYKQTSHGPFFKIQTEFTKSSAVKEAKRLAMELKLGFETQQDIIT